MIFFSNCKTAGTFPTMGGKDGQEQQNLHVHALGQRYAKLPTAFFAGGHSGVSSLPINDGAAPKTCWKLSKKICLLPKCKRRRAPYACHGEEAKASVLVACSVMPHLGLPQEDPTHRAKKRAFAYAYLRDRNLPTKRPPFDHGTK